MSTGQAPILIRSSSDLDAADATSNVATADAERKLASNVDGLDIYPRTVTTEHLFAADGSFEGLLRAGTIYVGSGGVTISTASDGSTPSTGLFLSSSELTLYKSGVETVNLDGTTGILTATEFVLTPSATSKFRTAASGARVEIDNAGVKVYDASAAPGLVKASLTTNGLMVRNANDMSPTVAERASFQIQNGSEVGWIAGYAEAGGTGIIMKALSVDTVYSANLEAGSARLSVWDSPSQDEINLVASRVEIGGAADGVSIAGATDIDAALTVNSLKVGTAPFQSAWTSYAAEASILSTPDFTLSNITITRAVYCVIGPVCFYEISIVFQTGSCGAGDISLLLKVPAAYTIANTFATGAGTYRANGGTYTQGHIEYGDTTHLLFRKQDLAVWTDTASANNGIHVSGFFTWTAA